MCLSALTGIRVLFLVQSQVFGHNSGVVFMASFPEGFGYRVLRLLLFTRERWPSRAEPSRRIVRHRQLTADCGKIPSYVYAFPRRVITLSVRKIVVSSNSNNSDGSRHPTSSFSCTERSFVSHFVVVYRRMPLWKPARRLHPPGQSARQAGSRRRGLRPASADDAFD